MQGRKITLEAAVAESGSVDLGWGGAKVDRYHLVIIRSGGVPAYTSLQLAGSTRRYAITSLSRHQRYLVAVLGVRGSATLVSPWLSLSCFRGHLYRGRESAPPMSDELSRFLYQELAPEERERAYVDLVAEPASAIETGRIADVAARCLAEAPGARSRWIRRLVQAGTTCLLGGNVVELSPDGPAYGLTHAGQVVRLGLEDLAGAASSRRCEACGRDLEVIHRVELPGAPAAAVDRALLAATSADGSSA
jgi:hypothetical protein